MTPQEKEDFFRDALPIDLFTRLHSIALAANQSVAELIEDKLADSLGLKVIREASPPNSNFSEAARGFLINNLGTEPTEADRIIERIFTRRITKCVSK